GGVLAALDKGRKGVPRQAPRLRAEGAMAVREEELGFAAPAGVEEELARSGIAGRVLRADAEIAVAPRDPVRLAAPAAVDDPVLEREDLAERRDGGRSVGFLQERTEDEAGGEDLEHAGTPAACEPAP